RHLRPQGSGPATPCRWHRRQDQPGTWGAAFVAARQDRWEGRPWAARLLRIAIGLTPIVASLLVAVLLDRVLPRFGVGWAPAVGRWLVVCAASTVALVVADRWARRALPLATLLRMTMLFPDQAPSRFA